MILSVAQTKPVTGNVPANIEAHKALIELAAKQHADLIIFPELSITGYEPALAKTLATTIDDSRFDVFQHLSNKNSISIGVGAPIQKGQHVSIGLVIFQPHAVRNVYFKKHLHSDENPFFIPGENLRSIVVDKKKISLAICYEITVTDHARKACSDADGIYIASVAKSVAGTASALTTLSETARQFSTLVMMSNCIGVNDGERCAGQSSAWSRDGELIGQLDSEREGILVVDTADETCMISYLQDART